MGVIFIRKHYYNLFAKWILGKCADAGSRPVLFIENICADYFLAGRLTANIWLTSSPQIMNIITSPSLIYVPLSAHTNKLTIPLNKTGLLPGPANFPIIIHAIIN